MVKTSIFRDFIGVLKLEWSTVLPAIKQIEKSLEVRMPKASTFHAGMSPKSGMHIFLRFQHSSKAWEVGRFTINVIVSRQFGGPANWNTLPPDGDEPFAEGSYRIGVLLEGRDKWWHLKEDRDPLVTETWRPTDYSDYDSTLKQAALDVTVDVRKVLARLGTLGMIEGR